MFKTNLEQLKNERLKNTLSNIDISECTKEISFVKTEDGNIVFLKGEVPVEETTKPIEYIRSLISDDIKQMTHNDIVISVGFGVGYILDELYNATDAKIVIYEPDTKFLRFIFETIELSNFLKDKRVFISDNKNECLDFILKNYLNDDKIEFVQSKVLAIFYHEELKEFTDELYIKLKNKIIDINTTKIYMPQWVSNIIRFIKLNQNYYSIQNFKNKFIGKHAIILGAGPSLEDNIEQIKANRDKFTIFAVNKTLNLLSKEGITPDFAIFSDARGVMNEAKYSKEYVSNLNIIKDWKSDIKINELNPKNIIMYFSDNELFLSKYANEIGIKQNPSVQSTTILAILAANIMGFSKIYLCGLDLVFKGNQAYASSDEVDIKNNSAIISNTQKNIVEVDTITGKKAYTREDYSIFIKSLEDLIKYNNLNNLYNITDFGALIKGMNYTSFDKINTFGQKYNTDEIISQTPIANYNFKICIEQEKKAMLEIYNNIMNKASINKIVKSIIENTTLLYEYLQFDMIELSRNIDNQATIDKFYSNCILAIDKITALI